MEETDETSNSYNYIERQNIEEERYIWQLCFCEVIVKIKADGWKKFVFVHSEFKKVFSFICDSIGLQSFGHVQVVAKVFPRVAGCVGVVGEVPLQNLIHGLFCTHLEEETSWESDTLL